MDAEMMIGNMPMIAGEVFEKVHYNMKDMYEMMKEKHMFDSEDGGTYWGYDDGCLY